MGEVGGENQEVSFAVPQPPNPESLSHVYTALKLKFCLRFFLEPFAVWCNFQPKAVSAGQRLTHMLALSRARPEARAHGKGVPRKCSVDEGVCEDSEGP